MNSQKIWTLPTALILSFTFVLGGCSAPLKSGEKKVASSSAAKLRPYEKRTLDNGIPVFIFPDESLPYISLSILVKSGDVAESEGKSGLALYVARLLDKGAAGKSAQKIAEEIAQIGAEYGATASHDHIQASISGLVPSHDQIINIFADIVMRPNLSSSEKNRLQKQQIAQIEGTIDEPDTFVDVMFNRLLYQNHPYSRRTLGKLRDVRGFKSADANRFYKEHFVPGNVIMSVVGQIQPQTWQKLNETFGKWQGAAVPQYSQPIFQDTAGRRIKWVVNPSLKQSHIVLGHGGVIRKDPNYLALQVVNSILGGAFSSRLMSEIRTRRGLTYSIGSSFGGSKLAGAFAAETFTRHEKVEETLRETLNVIEKFRREGVSAQELEDAKSYLKGQLPRTYITAEKFAQTMMLYDLLGVPETYLSEFSQNINKIDLATANKLIQQYIQPENFKILVYTNDKSVVEKVKDLGSIEIQDYKSVEL